MHKIFNFAFTFILLLFFLTPLSARDLSPSDPMKQHHGEMERIRQEIQKRQQEELEQLKKIDPKLYEETKAALATQVKIDSIVSLFFEGKLSESSAESQLYPLVKQSIQEEINDLPGRITRIEKQLEFLKRAQRNPDLLFKKRIDEILGKSKLTPEELTY